MKLFINRIVFFLSIFLAVISSCDKAPVPEINWMPEFTRLYSVPESTSVELVAELKASTLAGSRYSFHYGADAAVAKTIEAIASGRTIRANISGLTPETKYYFRAYASNGKAEICSDIEMFTTLPKQDEPNLPQEPDSPSEPDAPSEPDLLPEFEVVTTNLSTSSTANDVYVEVSGNVDYEVIIPEDAGWVKCKAKSAQRCTLSVDMNLAQKDRSCEIIFSSLEHDCEYVVTLTQQAMEVYYRYCPHHMRFYDLDSLPGAEKIISADPIDKNGNVIDYYDGDHWCVTYPSASYGASLSVNLHRNNTINNRTQRILVTAAFSDSGLTENRAVIIVLTQYSSLERMEFQCEAVERRCVELWDTNSDGVLSYGEAEEAQRPGIFTGTDMTSFDEFQWFVNLRSFSDYMFAGTDLESINLPKHIGFLEEGMFMNCTRLRDIDMSTILLSLDRKTFMGCSSLENAVLARPVAPDQVFSGCTSLKTCTIVDDENTYDCESYIGVEAFKGCGSLQELTLHSNLSEIRSSAFSGCTSLRALYFKTGRAPSVAFDAFDGTHPDLRLYVPSQVLTVYKNAWPQWEDKIVGY